MPTQHLCPLRSAPGHKLAGQPRFANARLAYHEHRLRLPSPGLLKAPDELAESGRPPQQRVDELGWGAALRYGRPDGGAPAALRQGATVFRQGDRLRRGRDLQRLGQVRLEGGIDLQGGSRIPSCQGHAHEAPGGLFRQRIERHPPCEGGPGRLKLPGGFLPEGEPIQQQEQAHLPLALLLLAPRTRATAR